MPRTRLVFRTNLLLCKETWIAGVTWQSRQIGVVTVYIERLGQWRASVRPGSRPHA